MIGKRLKRLRENADLTQTDLSNIFKIGSTSISKYESDEQEPPDYMKIKFAEYFNVSVDYLVGLIDEPVSYKPKNIIKLPDDFPEELIPVAKHFIDYLNTTKKKPLK